MCVCVGRGGGGFLIATSACVRAFLRTHTNVSQWVIRVNQIQNIVDLVRKRKLVVLPLPHSGMDSQTRKRCSVQLGGAGLQ